MLQFPLTYSTDFMNASMAIRNMLVLLLALVTLGLCDSFIFPPNATHAEDDTTVASITVHFNDTMTVQYELPTGGTLAVIQACYPSIKSLNSSSGSYPTYSRTDTCTIATLVKF